MNTHDFGRFGLAVPDILFPAPHFAGAAWGAAACDQYTQDAGYWARAEAAREGKPSTLSLVLPEAFLAEKEARLPAIHRAMRDYLASGVFSPPRVCAVYVERRTAFGRTRRGLVAAVDLEAYDWKPEARALIRATEETIAERIPPRMDIRRGAALETPHVMLLANDPEKRLVEGAGEAARRAPPVYDTELMLGAGRVTGWTLAGEAAYSALEGALEALAADAARNGAPLFAVGDGNHSLASAKAVWEEWKGRHPGAAAHPLRWALAEIVNIYDEGLTFEPIHRALFGKGAEEAAGYAAARLGARLRPAPAADVSAAAGEDGVFRFAWRGADGGMRGALLDAPPGALPVCALQPALDAFLAGRRDCSIDYIHGGAEALALASEQGALAVLMPPVPKERFFAAIAEQGTLPRKSFSLGEASEKRFYFECRRLE